MLNLPRRNLLISVGLLQLLGVSNSTLQDIVLLHIVDHCDLSILWVIWNMVNLGLLVLSRILNVLVRSKRGRLHGVITVTLVSEFVWLRGYCVLLIELNCLGWGHPILAAHACGLLFWEQRRREMTGEHHRLFVIRSRWLFLFQHCPTEASSILFLLINSIKSCSSSTRLLLLLSLFGTFVLPYSELLKKLLVVDLLHLRFLGSVINLDLARVLLHHLVDLLNRIWGALDHFEPIRHGRWWFGTARALLLLRDPRLLHGLLIFWEL